MSWHKSFGQFFDWTVVIPDPQPGYPLYWVNGIAEAPNCEGTAPCDCVPGEANNDSSTNILDITYLIAFLYSSGPPPPCMYEGDASGNCAVNILDITYLIAFLYQTGPSPICATSCPGW